MQRLLRLPFPFSQHTSANSNSVAHPSLTSCSTPGVEHKNHIGTYHTSSVSLIVFVFLAHRQISMCGDKDNRTLEVEGIEPSSESQFITPSTSVCEFHLSPSVRQSSAGAQSLSSLRIHVGNDTRTILHRCKLSRRSGTTHLDAQ